MRQSLHPTRSRGCSISRARRSGYRPGGRPGLPQRLPAADAGCDLGGGGRQDRHRWGQVRSSGLQPPGGGLSDLGRRGHQPLPYKYVVTDTGIPGRLSVTTVMSDWNVAPAVDDARFTFVPPRGTSGSVHATRSQQRLQPLKPTGGRPCTRTRIAGVAMALVVMPMADVPHLPVTTGA